jgi:hypothetical protein
MPVIEFELVFFYVKLVSWIKASKILGVNTGIKLHVYREQCKTPE